MRQTLTSYFVTRHPATKVWAKEQEIKVDYWLEHISDLILFHEGDVIYGTLPIQIAAQLCHQGVRYGHFSLQVPPHMRGVDLSVDQLSAFQPKIEFFSIKKVT